MLARRTRMCNFLEYKGESWLWTWLSLDMDTQMMSLSDYTRMSSPSYLERERGK